MMKNVSIWKGYSATDVGKKTTQKILFSVFWIWSFSLAVSKGNTISLLEYLLSGTSEIK